MCTEFFHTQQTKYNSMQDNEETALVNDVGVGCFVDMILGIHLLQRHITDFDALVEGLGLYEE